MTRQIIKHRCRAIAAPIASADFQLGVSFDVVPSWALGAELPQPWEIYRLDRGSMETIRLPSIDRVWDIIERVGIAMMTTKFPGGLRARPLEARPNRQSRLIFFLTDSRSGKDEEVAERPEVGLVFIDAADKAYLSITARAEIVRDRAKAVEIWKHTDAVWWPGGPDDPTLRVLRVEPITAELWDGPSSALVAAFEFMKADLTGAKPNLGENRKITLPMS